MDFQSISARHLKSLSRIRSQINHEGHEGTRREEEDKPIKRCAMHQIHGLKVHATTNRGSGLRHEAQTFFLHVPEVHATNTRARGMDFQSMSACVVKSLSRIRVRINHQGHKGTRREEEEEQTKRRAVHQIHGLKVHATTNRGSGLRHEAQSFFMHVPEVHATNTRARGMDFQSMSARDLQSLSRIRSQINHEGHEGTRRTEDKPIKRRAMHQRHGLKVHATCERGSRRGSEARSLLLCAPKVRPPAGLRATRFTEKCITRAVDFRPTTSVDRRQ
jgi:hypothetical protein